MSGILPFISVYLRQAVCNYKKSAVLEMKNTWISTLSALFRLGQDS